MVGSRFGAFLVVSSTVSAALCSSAAHGQPMEFPLSSASASFLGEGYDDRIDSISSAGDVDGDGYDEFLFGTGRQDSPVTDAGKVYLVRGRSDGWSPDTPASQSKVSLVGEAAYDAAGRQTAPVGDVNGDGYDDFLVAAPLNDAVVDGGGQIYLLLGGHEGVSSGSLAEADASFLGGLQGHCAGYSIAGIGDVNGDGYDDFAIGAPLLWGSLYDGERVFVFLGRPSGWTMDMPLDLADASFLGEVGADTVGADLAGLGDVNGDGLDDFAIGAPNNDEAAISAGQVYLILGRTSGWALDTPLALADASFLGEVAGDAAGQSVAGAGDVDGDGYDDLLIGAPLSSAGGFYSGRVYLIRGRASGWSRDTSLGSSDASFVGVEESWLGDSIAGVGDVNEDGYADVMVSEAPNEANEWNGRAHLFFGGAGKWTHDLDLDDANVLFTGEGTLECAGEDVASAGDVDGDGKNDLLITAPRRTGLAELSGEVYLVLTTCVDQDGDGSGSPGSVFCPRGPVEDCNDGDPQIYPGAPEPPGRDLDCDGWVPITIHDMEADDGDASIDGDEPWIWGDAQPGIGLSCPDDSESCWYIADAQASGSSGLWFAFDTADLLDGFPARVFWDQVYDLEYGFDGGIVALQAGASPWTILTPLDGYDVGLDADNALGGVEAFSGKGDASRDSVLIDSSSLPAGGFSIGWIMGTDGSVGAPGWAVDNVSLAVTDVDGDTFGGSSDCDEEDPTTHDGAQEVCDGADNDCDGDVDEDCIAPEPGDGAFDDLPWPHQDDDRTVSDCNCRSLPGERIPMTSLLALMAGIVWMVGHRRHS